jgi:hypothetical protein
MRFPAILVTTVAAALSLPIAAGAAAQSAEADAGAQNSAQANAVTDRYLTAVPVELTSKVDSRNAVVGQEVTARTKDIANLADGTTLPKGTRLVGHVMQVRAGGKEEGLAVLALTFDRAELKGGQIVAVRSVIRAVAPAGNAPATERTFSGPSAPMSTTTGAGVGPAGRTSTRSGVGLGGGGLPGTTAPSMGGSAGTTVPSVDDPMGGTATGAGGTVPSMGDPIGSPIGGVADTRSLGGTTAATPDRRVVDAGERTSPAARATAIPGVMLSNTAVANASGTLTAFGRNISLESGTQITLGMITR